MFGPYLAQVYLPLPSGAEVIADTSIKITTNTVMKDEKK